MYGAGYYAPEWRRGSNGHWRKSRPWDELDAREGRNAEEREAIRSMRPIARPRRQTTPERKAAAERLHALRAELRTAREHDRQYKALARVIQGWTLEQVQAAVLWDKLERNMGGEQGNGGLDAWERSLLAAQRLKLEPELVKARERHRKNPYDSKGHAKRLPRALYIVFMDTRYTPPCRTPAARPRRQPHLTAAWASGSPDSHAAACMGHVATSVFTGSGTPSTEAMRSSWACSAARRAMRSVSDGCGLACLGSAVMDTWRSWRSSWTRWKSRAC